VEKKIAWQGFPSPQKGFRATGQEAAAGLALRLRRGREDGDIVSPLTRGLPLLLMCLDDPALAALAQVGKKGTVRRRDLQRRSVARRPSRRRRSRSHADAVGMAYAANPERTASSSR
jgi:hypothetical protein